MAWQILLSSYILLYFAAASIERTIRQRNVDPASYIEVHPETPRSKNKTPFKITVGKEKPRKPSSSQLRTSLIKPLKPLHRIRSLRILLHSHPILFANIVLSGIVLL